MASNKIAEFECAIKLAEIMDGKLLVVTNVKDIELAKIIERYKSLADIERGFKVLKSEFEIGPVYHRLPERIRAHASICFMALISHRVKSGAADSFDADFAILSGELSRLIPDLFNALDGELPPV